MAVAVNADKGVVGAKYQIRTTVAAVLKEM